MERCASYDPKELLLALKKAVEGAGELDVAGKTVLLKPNMLLDLAVDKMVTTHPAFLEAVIALVREMGAKRILAGDSPGIEMPGFQGKACGLRDATLKSGAEWVAFSSGKTEVSCPDGKLMKKFTVAQAAQEADLIISLPKLKTHQLMYFTGAMKNVFGFIPSLAKSAFHARFPGREAFASMIVDLNLALKPAYAMMDAVVGMEGPGPQAGTPRQIGLVLASSNLLAIDMAASLIIGYPPGEIPIHREALSRGFWLSNTEEMEYPGLSPENVKIPDFVKVPIRHSGSQFLDFFLPRPARRWMDSLAPGPEICREKCVRCGDCARICGSQAMALAGERIIIDYKRCIRCFCCHEICPEKAIHIAKRPQNR